MQGCLSFPTILGISSAALLGSQPFQWVYSLGGWSASLWRFPAPEGSGSSPDAPLTHMGTPHSHGHPSLTWAPQVTRLPFLSTGGGPTVTTAVLASTGGPPEGGVTGRARSYGEVPQFSLWGVRTVPHPPLAILPRLRGLLRHPVVGIKASSASPEFSAIFSAPGMVGAPRGVGACCVLLPHGSPYSGSTPCLCTSRGRGNSKVAPKTPAPPGVHTLSYPCS